MMKYARIVFLACSFLPMSVFADESYYCPQKSGYINIGMTMDQVISACGQPIAQQDAQQPVFQRIPIQQLIYNNQGINNAFWGVWNVSTGTGGTTLQVNIMEDKVKSIQVNGSDNNAFSICRGTNIEIGDPVGKVYGACGSPSLTNNTFYNQIIPTKTKPQIWTYKPSEYESTVSLTFVDGKLQSINK